jgi:hypothetical protein
MMDQLEPQGQPPAVSPDEAAAPTVAAVDEAAASAAPPSAAPAAPAPALTRGAGRRILAALVLLPWAVGYGSVGAWAVAFGARAAAGGHAVVDAGYTRLVTPGGVILVGALLLAAFATVLAAALLLVFGSRRRGAWTVVAVVAAVLTAGAVWAGVRGELVPILWVLFFFGLVYALVVAVVGVWRAGPRERVLSP